jgi:transposase
MKLYNGIDLHSNNSHMESKIKEEKELFSKRIPNDLNIILKTLSPYKSEMFSGEDFYL